MYDSLNLKGNIFGGITAAVIALPLGLAFGVASGLGATAGIYGAIVLGFFASLFGGTPTQISGPTGPMTVVVAAAVLTLQSDISLIASMILLAGVFQIIFGFLKVGKYIQYIPYPVISGFMSGIGAIIIILQINPFLGIESNPSVINVLWSLKENFASINFQTFILGSLTLAIMFFTPLKMSKIIPAPLIALVVLTPLSIVAGFDIPIIGDIPAGLPDFIMPSLSIESYGSVVTLALTLAVLGTMDTLLTSIVADSITGTKHKPNQELLGQGIGNIMCSLIGALPGAGATMRTVINVKSGGTNRLSGIIHAITLLLVVLFLAPVASKIPLALLAGILIKVGVDILDYRFLEVWKDSPRHDLIVMLTVFFITVFIDLITAVGVGVALACMLIVYRITKETQIVLDGADDEEQKYCFLDKNIRIIKINGAFFFGSSTIFENNINSILDTKTIIIDISNVPFIDLTAIFTIKDLLTKIQEDNIEVIIVAKQKHKEELLKLNKTHVFDSVKFFKTMKEASLHLGSHKTQI